MSQTKKVVLAGATGNLGGLIAEALLDKPGVFVTALVRPGSTERLADLEARGLKPQAIDLSQSSDSDLDRSMEGAFSVVSALQGGPDVIVGLQSRLLASAARVGVSRFLPSDFSFNIFGLDDGDNLNTDWRREFARQSERLRGGVSVIHVLNGCFLDRNVLFGFLGAIDLPAKKAFLWGDGREKMDFTTYKDSARFAVEAAVDDREVPASFNVAGDVLDFHELVAAYERASGNKLQIEVMGSLADLDAEIARRQQREPGNVFSYLPLMYWRAMLNGKGKLGPLVNERYPAIQPTTVERYVREESL